MQPDGKILIGGIFGSALGVPRNFIARLNTDGTLDTLFNPDANGDVYSIAVQADGQILVGGAFTSIGGQGHNGIARLEPTLGSADVSFSPNANNVVLVIAIQADGKILVGGFFTSIAGQVRNYVARLDASNGVADSWNPNADATVRSIAVQPDGKVLVGGDFHGTNSIGGQTRDYIARLNASDGLADSFDPNANSSIFSIALQADGKVLVGGGFTTIGGQARNYLARLDAATGLADSFDPNPDRGIFSIAVQADGRILVGGAFTSIRGETRNRIARLGTNDGLPDSFDPDANNEVRSIALQADGKIFAGGFFNNIGGEVRNGLARSSNDTIARQELGVTQTAVTWARSGSSPQLTRVIFEDSTDGVSYNFLGQGTPADRNWTLTGLNLSIGQNIYIRARGFYRGGYFNGSESITETVRNAFITAAPLQLTTAVSRKTHGAAGDFDINLLNANFGPECRSSGGAHTLVFTFSNNVVSGNASVTTGIGSVSGTPIFAGNTMTVSLAGVADVQKITVTLSDVTDNLAQVLPNTAVSVNMLIGDVNGTKVISASDISQVKAWAGTPVDATSFRADVAVNGAISATDISLVKSRSGQSLP